IRNDLYKNVILDSLSDGSDMTLSKISNQISSELRLSRSIDSATLMPHLNNLLANGYLSKEVDVYRITELGKDHILVNQEKGASSLVSGRNKIRAALEAAIGLPIVEDEFSRIWNVFEDRMSHYFQSRGESI